MYQRLESTGPSARQSPVRPQDNGLQTEASRTAGQPASLQRGSGGPGLIRSALAYAARAVEDLETMLFPFPDLSARQPRLPSAPQVRYDRKDRVAAEDVRRNGPLIGSQVKAWIDSQAPGTAAAGARIFCDDKPGQWTPLTAQLADLVVADCGPRLAQWARDIVSGAGSKIESASRCDSQEDQARAVVNALANEICITNSDRSARLFSPDLVRHLGDMRRDVQDWTLRHGGRGWEQVGLPGAHVVGNILFACGLRAVVEQLRREAQTQPPTPSNRWIEGRGGLARVSEADLYGMLEEFCLDLTHGQRDVLLENHGLSLAAKVGKTAHPAAKQLHTTIAYSRDVKQLQPATLTPNLVTPGKHGQRTQATTVIHPLQVASPLQSDSQRTPSSRSRSEHSELSAAEFMTPGRHPAQEPGGSDD